MKSAPRGKNTSDVALANVSVHGFWLLLDEREVFLPFEDFPRFRDATVRELANVVRPQPHHLHWPDLDVDLAVESVDRPERYPLKSRLGPRRPTRKTTRRRRGPSR